MAVTSFSMEIDSETVAGRENGISFDFTTNTKTTELDQDPRVNVWFYNSFNVSPLTIVRNIRREQAFISDKAELTKDRGKVPKYNSRLN